MYRPTPNSQLKKKLHGISQLYQEPQDNRLFVPLSPVRHHIGSVPPTPCPPNPPTSSYTRELHTPTSCFSTPCTSVPYFPKSPSVAPEMAVSQSKLLYYQIATSSPVPACPLLQCQVPESPISPGTIPSSKLEMYVATEIHEADFSMPPPPFRPVPPNTLPLYPMPPSPLPSYPNSPTQSAPYPVPPGSSDLSYLPPCGMPSNPLPPYPVPPSSLPLYQMTNPLDSYPTPPSPEPPFPITACYLPTCSVPPPPMPPFSTPPSSLHHNPSPVTPLPPFPIQNGPAPPYSIPTSPSSAFQVPRSGLPSSGIPSSQVSPFMTPAYPVDNPQMSFCEMDSPTSPRRPSLGSPPTSSFSTRQDIPAPSMTRKTYLPTDEPSPASPIPERLRQENRVPEMSSCFSLIPVSPVPSKPFFSRRKKAGFTKRDLSATSPEPTSPVSLSPTPCFPSPSRPFSRRPKNEESIRGELIPSCPIPATQLSIRRESLERERFFTAFPVTSSPVIKSLLNRRGSNGKGVNPGTQVTSSPLLVSPVSFSPTPDSMVQGRSLSSRRGSEGSVGRGFLSTSPIQNSPHLSRKSRENMTNGIITPVNSIPNSPRSSRKEKNGTTMKDSIPGCREPSSPIPDNPVSCSPIPVRLFSSLRKKEGWKGKRQIPKTPIPGSPAPPSPTSTSPIPARLLLRRKGESSAGMRETANSPIPPNPLTTRLILGLKDSPVRRFYPGSPAPPSPTSTSPIPASLLSRRRKKSPGRRIYSSCSPLPTSPLPSSPHPRSPIPVSPTPPRMISRRRESPDRRASSRSPKPTRPVPSLLVSKKKGSPIRRSYSPARSMATRPLSRRKDSPSRSRHSTDSPLPSHPTPNRLLSNRRVESPSRSRHTSNSPLPSSPIPARGLSRGRRLSPARRRVSSGSPGLASAFPKSPNLVQSPSRRKSPSRSREASNTSAPRSPVPARILSRGGRESPKKGGHCLRSRVTSPLPPSPIPSNHIQAWRLSNGRIETPVVRQMTDSPDLTRPYPESPFLTQAREGSVGRGQIPPRSVPVNQMSENASPRRSVSCVHVMRRVTTSSSVTRSPIRNRGILEDATCVSPQQVQGSAVSVSPTTIGCIPISRSGSSCVPATRESRSQRPNLASTSCVTNRVASNTTKQTSLASSRVSVTSTASNTTKHVSQASVSASNTIKATNVASNSLSCNTSTSNIRTPNLSSNIALSVISQASNTTRITNLASRSLPVTSSASKPAKPSIASSSQASAIRPTSSTTKTNLASISSNSSTSEASNTTKLERPTSLPLNRRRVMRSGLIQYPATGVQIKPSNPRHPPTVATRAQHLNGPSPEPPSTGVLPQATASVIPEPDADSQVEDETAEGSVRAEPILTVTQAAEDQSEAENDVPSSSHSESSADKGGGGSVSVATCEHRFSSTGGAPPPYSRLPPDGHEFPSNYAEGLPDKMSRYARYSRLAMELDSPGSPPPSSTSTPSTPRTRSAPGTPLGPPPPIPRSSSSSNKTFSSEKTLESGNNNNNNKWSGNEERRSREPTPTRNRWRRQDERSERSVRDKIAMFSTDGPDQPHPKTRKLDKQEGEEGTMKRAFTEDDVRLDTSGSSSGKNGRDAHGSPRSLSKTSVFSSMINVSTSETKDNTKHMSTASSEMDIRQETPPTPRSHGLREEKRSDDESSGLHARSQSLIDIGRTSLTKRHSVGAYDRPSVYQYGIEKPEERERRTSLTNLIEQRRKSFGSKLLGLVIPESRSNEGGDKASIDLPRISSVPPTTASKTMSLPREGQRSPRLYKADSISSIDSCESNTSRHSSLNAPPWKSHGTSTLPKYSPAFKRKNMTVFSKPENLPPPSGRSPSACSSSPTSDLSQASPTPMSHSPPKSLENISPPGSEHTYDMTDGRYSSDKHGYSKLSLSQKNSLESRLNRAEDSDNDSAVSSTQSSYSQGMSPPSSPMPEQDEMDDRRGRGYRSRLSQQNSLDEQDAARRVLKRGSIEAENRRNVINSARCSSGRNSDEHQTPEIIRKYSSASDKVEDSDRFPHRLDTELREGPKVTGLRRQASTSSTSSTASSRRSSHDSSRRNSKDSVIHVTKYDEAKVSAEPVYFDQEGEMYKESQLKVAYVNEITDDYEQLNDSNPKEVIAEVPLASPPSRRNADTKDAPETTQTAPSNPNPNPNPRKGTNRWAELEMKYGNNSTTDIESKIQRMRRASDSSSPDRTKKKSGGFRALAEKWQQRAEEDTAAPPQPTLTRRESNSRLEAPARTPRQFETRPAAPTHERPTRPSRLYDDQTEVDGGQAAQSDLYSESTQSSSNSLSSNDSRSENLDIPRAEVPDRKLSMPEYGNTVKMRDRREGGAGGAPSRPTSLIEGGDGSVIESHYLTACSQISPAASTDSRDELFTPETSLSRTASKEVLDAFSRPRNTPGVSFPRVGASTTPKMADIMRAFERHDLGKRGAPGGGSSHPRMSSLDSTNSDEGLMGAHYGSVTSLASGQRDQYGSITSLASSTSLISPQELAQLIEEANQSLEESGTPSHEILVVVLHREIVGHGSIGITLAGGADYEAKEITVHKVIPGSLADRDGRIQRGDRVLSINGKNLRGVTHKEALSILKSPRPEVVLVLSRSRSVTPQESNMTDADGSFVHRPSLINHVTSPRPPKILESPMDSKSLISDVAAMSVPRGPPFTITLVKDGAGLGFSLEGGKDSPLGDRPLTVKKIFSGGAADKGGVLKVGDELVSVNTVDVTGMARIEAWNFLKKLPDGTVTLVLRQKLVDYTPAKNEE